MRIAAHVQVGLQRQEFQHRGLVLGHDRRLVGDRDALDPLPQLGQLGFEAAVDGLDGGPVLPRLHRLELFGCIPHLHRALDELEPRLDDLELARDQLLGLDQDVLADPNLAEVVQQARVAKLLELVIGQCDVAVLARGDLGHRAREPCGQTLDAA